jgi:hypothetical protein
MGVHTQRRRDTVAVGGRGEPPQQRIPLRDRTEAVRLGHLLPAAEYGAAIGVRRGERCSRRFLVILAGFVPI